MIKIELGQEGDVEFLYKLGAGGWSDLILVLRDDVYFIGANHVFHDPLSDIIGLCSALIDDRDAFVKFCGVNGATLLDVKINRQKGDLVQINLFGIADSDGSDEGPELEVTFQMKLSRFIDLFISQLESVSVLYAVEPHITDRSPFPSEAFKNLQQQWAGHDLSRRNGRQA